MTLIKYYEIESSYQSFLSRLEKRFEKDAKSSVLDENHTRCLSVGDGKYDSGNFSVLYLKSEKVGGWRFEKSGKIGRVLSKIAGLELVVKGDEDNIGFLDDYLEDSPYKVIHTNEVLYATFSFTTYFYHKEKIHNFIYKIHNYIGLTHHNLGRRLYQENNADPKIDNLLCSGFILGRVEDVLETRDFILKKSSGIKIYQEDIEFKRNKPQYLIALELQERRKLLEQNSDFDLSDVEIPD